MSRATGERRSPLAGRVVVGLAGTRLAEAEARLLARFSVAGVILFRRNVEGLDQLRALCAQIGHALADVDRLPPLICADQEGGSVAPLVDAIGRPPSLLALALADDVALTRRVHRETGHRLRAAGLNLALAPVADVATDENPVVSTRSFGDRPGRVATHVAAAIAGLRDAGVAACAKHWPGHGRPAVDSHLAVPTVAASVEALQRFDMVPFEAAVAANVASVMAGHLVVPALDPAGRTAGVSEPMLLDWLRGRLGFRGVVLSDAVEMLGFAGERSVEAFRAGCDAVLFSTPVERAASQLEALEAAVAREPAAMGSAARVEELRGALLAHVGALSEQRDTATPRAADVSFDDQPYREARERGCVIRSGRVGPVGRALPVAGGGTDRIGDWVLVDAASADRLLRAEDPLDSLAPGSAELSVLEPALRQSVGRPPARVVLLPSPIQESIAELMEQRLGELPIGLGLVVAALRPFRAEERAVWRRVLTTLGPPWVALLGDLVLRHDVDAAGTGASLILLPGAAPEDAGPLGAALREL